MNRLYKKVTSVVLSILIGLGLTSCKNSNDELVLNEPTTTLESTTEEELETELFEETTENVEDTSKEEVTSEISTEVEREVTTHGYNYYIDELNDLEILINTYNAYNSDYTISYELNDNNQLELEITQNNDYISDEEKNAVNEFLENISYDYMIATYKFKNIDFNNISSDFLSNIKPLGLSLYKCFDFDESIVDLNKLQSLNIAYHDKTVDLNYYKSIYRLSATGVKLENLNNLVYLSSFSYVNDNNYAYQDNDAIMDMVASLKEIAKIYNQSYTKDIYFDNISFTNCDLSNMRIVNASSIKICNPGIYEENEQNIIIDRVKNLEVFNDPDYSDGNENNASISLEASIREGSATFSNITFINTNFHVKGTVDFSFTNVVLNGDSSFLEDLNIVKEDNLIINDDISGINVDSNLATIKILSKHL